ncbi:uncharacterized protein LY79DRAFT_547476 [Colletotrichum navitas]|uniref:Secreted protein n=1 Tax=Colletotrichum navitas TaxID=681940 RepID=A0AAD8V8E1_9PEZI|nr:uncharacterized protein LY79DRAFT_547476 [Colletotrichum navitas]KAK1595355.1 hypothetical protein LY79DRAFT_547476 [Colletotrichum navitas]
MSCFATMAFLWGSPLAGLDLCVVADLVSRERPVSGLPTSAQPKPVHGSSSFITSRGFSYYRSRWRSHRRSSSPPQASPTSPAS